jgi:D-sedoheptulose 7-phosphate isomerase
MLGATLASDAYLQRLNREVSRIDQAAMQRWADLIFQAWENGRFVFIFGNGGSGTTASHMAEDLGKSTLHERDLSD